MLFLALKCPNKYVGEWLDAGWMTSIAVSGRYGGWAGMDGYLGSEEVAAQGEHAGPGLGGL